MTVATHDDGLVRAVLLEYGGARFRAFDTVN
jgi:hypothetical protein